jgi:thiamine biosynthesis lipoprotein
MPFSKLNNKPKLSKPTDEDGRIAFDAIGTSWAITIDAPISPEDMEALQKRITQRIEQYDKDYSRFRSDSLVSEMSKSSGNYRLPDDAEPLFDLYKQLYEISDGLVTPLIGQLLSDAGYDASYSLTPGQLRSVPSWDEVLSYHFPDLTVKQPVMLDVGAAGKGYIVDIVAELIKTSGIEYFFINAGGDILQSQDSFNSVSIGLEHPINLDEIVGLATLYNASLCGSSINRRSWGNFHHIMNPNTKESPRQILSTWVVADSTLLADGLATALFFIPAQKLNTQYAFDYALIMDDLSLEHSDSFPADFFVEERPASNV